MSASALLIVLAAATQQPASSPPRPEIHVQTAHVRVFKTLDVSADGTRLFTGAADGTAHVWDTATGEALVSLEGHRGGIYGLDYSADQNTIVTTSADGTLILWDASTGKRLRRYNIDQTLAAGFGLAPAVFSVDGRALISGDNDQITIWDASPLPDDIDAWVRENRFIASFTCEQRALYNIEPLCQQPV